MNALKAFGYVAFLLLSPLISGVAYSENSSPPPESPARSANTDSRFASELLASLIFTEEHGVERRLQEVQNYFNRLARARVDDSIRGSEPVERGGRLLVSSSETKKLLLSQLNAASASLIRWQRCVQDGEVFLPEFGLKPINRAGRVFYGVCDQDANALGPKHFFVATRFFDGEALGLLYPGEAFVRLKGYDLSTVTLEEKISLSGPHLFSQGDYVYDGFDGKKQVISTMQKVDSDYLVERVLLERETGGFPDAADLVYFMGSGGTGRNIVFVLEADGSTVTDYPQIVNNLARTLREMTERQQFSVIVFDGEGVKEVPPAGLRVASPAAKAATIAWLRDTANVKNSGTGDVIPALQLAARRRAEVVFLLSQNLYNPGRREYEQERSEILEAVKALPANLAINTIEFNQVDPLAGNGRTSLMEEIARLSNGGKWNFVQTNVEPLP